MVKGEVARLVYRAAVKAQSGDLQLRERLLDVAAQAPLPAAAQLRQAMLAGENAWLKVALCLAALAGVAGTA